MRTFFRFYQLVVHTLAERLLARPIQFIVLTMLGITGIGWLISLVSSKVAVGYIALRIAELVYIVVTALLLARARRWPAAQLALVRV